MKPLPDWEPRGDYSKDDFNRLKAEVERLSRLSALYPIEIANTEGGPMVRFGEYYQAPLSYPVRYITQDLNEPTNDNGVLSGSILHDYNTDFVTPESGDKILYCIEGDEHKTYGLYVLEIHDDGSWEAHPDPTIKYQTGIKVIAGPEGRNNFCTTWELITIPPFIVQTDALEFERIYQEIKWVQITDTTQVAGRYPGILYKNDLSLYSPTVEIWVTVPNASTPTVSTFYQALRNYDGDDGDPENTRGVYSIDTC